MGNGDFKTLMRYKEASTGPSAIEWKHAMMKWMKLKLNGSVFWRFYWTELNQLETYGCIKTNLVKLGSSKEGKQDWLPGNPRNDLVYT